MTNEIITKSRRRISMIMLPVFIISILVGGFLVGRFSGNIGNVVSNLERPSFFPPYYLFGLVWFCLYIMLGISFWLIWRQQQLAPLSTLIIFNIVFNFAYTYAFCRFGLLAGALDLILVLVSTQWLITAFSRISTLASRLLIPYLLWIIFALFLNISLIVLNPSKLFN